MGGRRLKRKCGIADGRKSRERKEWRKRKGDRWRKDLVVKEKQQWDGLQKEEA